MADYRAIEESLRQVLAGKRRPVAVAFLEEAPEGVAAFEGTQPSSCSFWRLAAEGRVFYTVAADHGNCPIGAYTHNLLMPARAPELDETLGLMSGLGYIRMEEIPGVHRLPHSPKVVAYAPLGDTCVPPSVVLASGQPGRVMLLAEAAARAGVMSSLPLLGRPTCMAIPAALENGAVASSGCIGNRVYTGIGEDEVYIVLRGSDVENIARELEVIRSANRTLQEYHEKRRKQLSTL